MLEGFEKYCPSQTSQNIPTLAIVHQGLIFNRNVANYLGEHTPVVFLINPDKKQIAVQKSDVKDKNAIKFFRKVESKRIMYRDLIRRVKEMANFDTEHYYYKVKGTIVDDEGVIIFNLNEAIQKDRIFRKEKEEEI